MDEKGFGGLGTNRLKMDHPRRNLYHYYFNNLFIDLAELGRKEQIARKNRPTDREDPPAILGNPSQFCVLATIRKAILNKWATYFFSPMDVIKDYEEPEIKSELCPCNKNILNIGLKPLLTLLNESQLTFPQLCSKALMSLLDMINQHEPEELSHVSSLALDGIIETLLSTSCIVGEEFNKPDNSTNLTAVACSSLVALVLAKGDTGQILKTIYTLLTAPADLQNQLIMLPNICTKLQRSAQSLVLGSVVFPTWSDNGMPKLSIYDKFFVKIPHDFNPSSICSDGVYLYLFCSRGLLKIGSGYMGTVKGFVYKYEHIFYEGSRWIGILKGHLYISFTMKNRLSLKKLSMETFECITDIQFDNLSKGVFISDGQNLGIISNENEDMKLDIIDIDSSPTEQCSYIDRIVLQITEKHSYIIGGDNLPDQHFYRNLKPTIFNNGLIKSENVCEIVKGNLFTLVRLSNGKVYYSGSGTVLGCNEVNKDDSQWIEIPYSACFPIKRMAVGHVGQHAVFITYNGEAVFCGTSQWGEDGELPKIGRQPRFVRNRSFDKLKGDSYVYAACNYGTTALVTRNGNLYMFGKDAWYCDLTGKVKFPCEQIVQVALGKAHTVFLTVTGIVYSFGLNNKGQCGRFNEQHEDEAAAVRKLNRKSHTRKFNPSKRSTRSTNVQLGESNNLRLSDEQYQLPPGPITLKEKVTQIACGLHHTVLLTKSGEVYTFGSNSYGQLGVGNTAAQRRVVKLNVPPARQIAAGSQHTVILAKTGEVYTLGANNAGQLARKIGNDDVSETWGGEPSTVSNLGPGFGYKAIWVGASGDSTFINIEKALINMQTLMQATVVSNKQNIVILPSLPTHTFTCIVINKENGVCKSFPNGDQVKFTGTLACLDPYHDVLWQYVPDGHVIKSYNRLTVGARNIKECSMYDCLFLKDLNEITLANIANSDRRSLSILSSELAIPTIDGVFINRNQLAIHILACLDTFCIAHSHNLPLQVDPGPLLIDKETGYQMINRFLVCKEKVMPLEERVDAIKFMGDCDFVLGGIMLYGGNDCIAKVKIFDIGYEQYDENDAKLIFETDEILYSCVPGSKYKLCFENAIPIEANRWYILLADITGNVVDCGEAGMPEVQLYDHHIYFANSRLSNKGTNVNFGQFPVLLVKGVPNPPPSKRDEDPVHVMSDCFGANVGRQGLDSLKRLLLWNWNRLKQEIWSVPITNGEEAFNKIKNLEKLEYTTRATLRLIKSCLNHIYPKKMAKRSVECEESVNGIYEIRQLLISMLTYKILDGYKKELLNPIGPKLKHIIENVLKETCQTFQELFHIFYPTPYLKWEILCTLLANIEVGSCVHYELFLSTVLASLSSCANLNLVLPVFFSTDSKISSKNVLLVEKMTNPSIEEINVDIENWHLTNTMEHLLELVMSPIKKHLQCEQYLYDEYDILVKNACDLLMRIVAELSFNAVGEEKDETSVVKGYIISTPNRFLEMSKTFQWNGSQDPDSICFEVNRSGIWIVGVTLFSTPGKHRYLLELHEFYAPEWKCIEQTRGCFESRSCNEDTIEIKFGRPILIKENRTYALRLWNVGAQIKSGFRGMPSVMGPDGTTFKFYNRAFGASYMDTTRGQIPSILYNRNSHLSLLSSTEGLDKFPPKHILKVAQLIVTKCAECLSAIRAEFTPENIRKCKALDIAPCLNNLIPFTLAHLSHLSDTESCVSILQMVHDLLPHVAALNLLIGERKDDRQNQPSLASTSQYVWVESAHPYKQACVNNYRVSFPSSVTWMALEMDPRSCTAQPEDSLRIYVSQNHDWNASYFYNENDSVDSNGLEEDQQTDCESVAYKNLTSDSEGPGKLNLVSITPKLSHIKEHWPQKTIIVPGNEVLFSMETASDYVKNENTNRFGFKCLVIGYEDLLDIPVSSERGQTAFSKLEMELTYIGGMCAASIMNPTDLYPDDVPNQPKAKSAQTKNENQGQPSEDINHSILSKGLSLLHTPDIAQALSGKIPYKSNSNEYVFLHDFINCAGDTAGARLARWLQPDPRVEITHCRIMLPEGEYYCGQELPVFVNIRDQEEQLLPVGDYNVKIIVEFMRSGEEENGAETQIADKSVQTAQPSETSEHISEYVESLMVKPYGFGRLCGMWKPQEIGRYTIKSVIDGQSTEIVTATVIKLEGDLSQNNRKQSLPKKIRNFYAEDSAGLRVRSHPTLQSEQIGMITVGGSITFEDVVINSDGLWLRLSHESIYIYCEDPINVSEAWCLQYNERIGKSLLFPNDKILSYWEKLVSDTNEKPKLEFLIMFPTFVWTGYGTMSAVYFTIDAGTIVSLEKMYRNNGITYGKLDKVTVKMLGFYDGKDYWILCSPINAHCVGIHPISNNQDNVHDVEIHDEPTRKRKRTAASHTKQDIPNDAPQPFRDFQPRFELSENDGEIEEIQSGELSSKANVEEIQYRSVGEIYERMNKTKQCDLMSSIPKNIELFMEVEGSDDEDAIDLTIQQASYTREKKIFEPKPNNAKKINEHKLKEEEQIAGGVNLSKAKSFRALFAAFLWHEGIVHDAMACASYLKFHPGLSKQGAKVMTRGPISSGVNTSQRHSVEVPPSAGNLHIFDSSWETLNRSAMNASANRSRTKLVMNAADVACIKEEDSVSIKENRVNDVISVLPSALRALLALWDAMSEILPQNKPENEEEKLFYSAKTKSMMTFETHQAEGRNPKKKSCNSKKTKGDAKNSDGGGQLGDGSVLSDEHGAKRKEMCGDWINDDDMHLVQHSESDHCHNRKKADFKVNHGDVDKVNWKVYESEHELEENIDIDSLIPLNHSIVKRNALYLLNVVSAASNDNPIKHDPVNVEKSLWSPMSTMQCLKNLSTGDDDYENQCEDTISKYNPRLSFDVSPPLTEINDNGNNLFRNEMNIGEPSTSGNSINTRFHRSISMGQDVLDKLNSKRKVIDDENANGDTSLLCNPSMALQALVGLDPKKASHHSFVIDSITPLKVNKEAIMARPVMEFMMKPRNITHIEREMDKTIRVAVMRKYGLEAFNWMLHTITQPTCLHDLLWWFVYAMNDHSISNNKITKKDGDDLIFEKPSVSWQDSFDCHGNNTNIKVRESLHAFLFSVCLVIPRLPPASPLLLEAVRTLALNFSEQDYLFLHRCGLIKTLSKIMSHSDEESADELEMSQFQNYGLYKGKPALKHCKDITVECKLKVSSSPEKLIYLIDGSTETFWESVDIDHNSRSWLQITLPEQMPGELVFVCLHIDNTRDFQHKTELVDIKMGSDIEDTQCKYFHLFTTSTEWLVCSWPGMAQSSSILCEFKGFDPTVRVRQLSILVEPYQAQHDLASTHSIIHNYIELETLKIFKFIASQVCTQNVSFNQGLSSENNELKEHMVGVLFAKNKFNTLQKQIMHHLITAIEMETKRSKLLWEKYNDIDESEDTENFDVYLANPDEYCFQMLSMVLALSGSHSGCTYLSEHSFVIKNLLKLLHTGSERVQRQIIAILRRMIKDISPQQLKSCLTLNYNTNCSLLDHLVSCMSKSLTVKVKGAYSPKLSFISNEYSVDFLTKLSNGVITIRDCMKNYLPAELWFLRGQISQKHSVLIRELLTDMLEGKISPQWAEATRTYIVDSVFKLTFLSDAEKNPFTCLSNPTLWLALGALSILQQQQVDILSTLGFDGGAGSAADKMDLTKPMCTNHDDGLTHAIIECSQCGANCQECDRILHLHRKNKNHQRQVCKAVKDIIRVDVHEGCGRVKLFWLLALVDRQNLKALIEFRNELENMHTNNDGGIAGYRSIVASGVCRYCGRQSNTGLLAIGNVCADHECQELSKTACTRVLPCGHQCGGILFEDPCLPCLRGCASSPAAAATMDQAAALPLTARTRPLRQDAEDMCMICFADPLSAAPAVQYKCGHVFHFICSKNILVNKWCGPRITFNFSRCPICKEDIYHSSLNEFLNPIRELEEEVKRKALARLEYDGQKEAAIVESRYKGDAIAYAIDRYAYYICFKCKKPYFGGEARCDADVGNNPDFNETELICGGCSNIACDQVCVKHGDDFLEYKCRFCCSIAIFFCLGDSHFCSGCHDEFQRIRSIPMENLPHCPAGPKGVQLDGSEEDCPLGVKHLPTGQEFALGCGICRNKTKKF